MPNLQRPLEIAKSKLNRRGIAVRARQKPGCPFFLLSRGIKNFSKQVHGSFLKAAQFFHVVLLFVALDHSLGAPEKSLAFPVIHGY